MEETDPMAPDSPESAEARFYAAFRAGDLSAMMSVWADGGSVVCVHPTGSVIEGHEAVAASWRHIFGAAEGGVDVRPVLHSVHAVADLAVHVVEEHLGPRGLAIATNVYRRGDGGWRMVLHHASPAGSRPLTPPAIH